MKFGLLGVAVRNLKRKSFRTAILVVSIGLLVSILVFGASFLLSVSSTIERAAARFGADVLVVPVGARDYAEEVLLETTSKTFYMDEGIMQRVREVEGVDRITHQTYLTTILGVCCDIPPVKVVSFNQDTDFIVGAWLQKAIGRRLEKGEAIIGFEAHENLGLLDMERSVLFGTEFKFVGLLDKTGTGLDNAIFISDTNIPDVIKYGKSSLEGGQISLIFVKVKDGYDPLRVSRNIEGEIIEVDTIERNDMGKRILATLKDINSVFLINIVLASVLSTFLTWTIFSAIVNERLREVGIMKAMGAKGSHIMTLFIVEVLILGLMGSLIGIVFGTYLSIALSKIFGILRDVSATLTVLERFEVSMLGLVVGTGICIAGALSPVIRMKKLDPLSALKEV